MAGLPIRSNALAGTPARSASSLTGGYRRLAVMIAGISGALGLLYWFPPATSWFYPPCMIRAASGLYCPGCGATRALHSLLHGDLQLAAQHNLLLIALLPALTTFVLVQAVSLAREGRWKNVRIPGFLPALLLVVMLVFAFVRNLPFDWARVLAP
ncbi:MAG: DUF2752 domain-containing protein [Bryobacterales bacterium]|nr:DUF2752 domain-containing protein [Bryobacterales bacterium]